MGQAKLRGSFETRRIEAEAKALVAKQEKDRIDVEIESNLTPEQRKRRKESKLLFASLLAVVCAV